MYILKTSFLVRSVLLFCLDSKPFKIVCRFQIRIVYTNTNTHIYPLSSISTSLDWRIWEDRQHLISRSQENTRTTGDKESLREIVRFLVKSDVPRPLSGPVCDSKMILSTPSWPDNHHKSDWGTELMEENPQRLLISSQQTTDWEGTSDVTSICAQFHWQL